MGHGGTDQALVYGFVNVDEQAEQIELPFK